MATFTDLASGLTAQRRKTRLQGRVSTLRGTPSPLSRPPGSLTNNAAALADLKLQDEPTFTETVQKPVKAPPPPKPVELPAAGPAMQLAELKMEGLGLGGPDPSNPQPSVTGAQVAAARGGGLKGWGSVIADTGKAVAMPAFQAVTGILDPFSAAKAMHSIYATGKKMEQDVASTIGLVPGVSDPGAKAMRGVHEATRGFTVGTEGMPSTMGGGPIGALGIDAGIGATGPMGLAAAIGGAGPGAAPGTVGSMGGGPSAAGYGGAGDLGALGPAAGTVGSFGGGPPSATGDPAGLGGSGATGGGIK